MDTIPSLGMARCRAAFPGLSLVVLMACACLVVRPADAAQSPTTDQRIDPGVQDLDEVVISARKRTEAEIEVPVSVTQYDAATIDRLNVRSFQDYATKTPNLSFSFGTAELGYAAVRSIAIRGITGEGTVGMYIDDMPVPESIDPRVVDIERIEVIRGPQGTLFGQGSLGGTLRIITRAPDDADTYVEARGGLTSGGSGPDYGVSFAGSESLVGDGLTGRLVGFVDHTAGFLTRSYSDANGVIVRDGGQGESRTYGGSAALLWAPDEAFSATLRFMGQRTTGIGWTAPYAPLPRFVVASSVLDRAADLQERSRDRWYMPSLVLNYHRERMALISSSSYFNRKAVDREDASEGTNWFYLNIFGLPLPPSLPIPWDIRIPTWRATNETRLTFETDGILSGVLGAYFSTGRSTQYDDGHDLPGIADSGLTSYPGYCPDTVPCPSYGSDLNWYSSYARDHTDRAVFGELYITRRRLQLTLGLRAYRDSQQLDVLTMGAGNGYSVTTGSSTRSGITPKAALAYRVDEQTLIYASIAKGFRQGVVVPPAPTTCGPLDQFGLTPGVVPKYKPDSVWNFEVGAKADVLQGRMLAKGAVFQMNWEDVRQRILLPVCYFSWRLNEGAARVRGGEIEVSGKPVRNVDLRAGIGYLDAKVTEQGVPGLPAVGSRVVQIPRVTANLSGTLTQALTARAKGFLTADFIYVGNSTSSTAGLDEPLVRKGYSLINGSVGVRWDRLDLSIYADNIGNSRPNFGDLNPAGYVSHVSLAPDAPILPRVATAQAFNMGVQVRYRF